MPRLATFSTVHNGITSDSSFDTEGSFGVYFSSFLAGTIFFLGFTNKDFNAVVDHLLPLGFILESNFVRKLINYTPMSPYSKFLKFGSCLATMWTHLRLLFLNSNKQAGHLKDSNSLVVPSCFEKWFYSLIYLSLDSHIIHWNLFLFQSYSTVGILARW